MKPYEKYKDSGVEWIGKVPEHWEVKKLSLMSEIVLGKMLTNDDKGDYFLKPYLRAANVAWEKVDISDVKTMWFSKFELEKLRIKKGDLLVSEGGEVGRTCIWDEELDECYLQNSVHKVTFFTGYNSKFFLYQFCLLGHLGFFDSIVNRISIAHLTGEKIKSITFLVPPLPEQTAIARYLDQKTGEIDQLIAKKERLLALWEEEKTALINQAVTRGLDAGAKMKDSGVAWLGEVPEGWEVKRLKYWVKSVLGGGTPSTNKTEFWKGTIPWVSPKDMKVPNIVETEDYVTELAIDGSAIQLILPNNILMVVRSGILKHTLPLAINSVPVTLNQDMKAFQPIERIGSQYFYFVLKGFSNSILANCKKVGSTVDSLTMEDLLNFEIPMATTYPEQTAIVRHIETQTARIQTQMDQTRKLIELLKEYRATLISEVVTGKVKVTE